jgi:transcriptional regulator with XRE-family HTH domain
MAHARTWRELLGQVIESPGERQRIAMELGVNPITLTRWVKGESNPRPNHLQRLPALLPRDQAELRDSIEKAFPTIVLPSRSRQQQNALPAIPTEFYSRVLHTLAITPEALLFRSLCDLILQQILEHLDPQRLGLAAIVASCMPPSHGNQVHSLREHVGRGTSPWDGPLEARAILLGSESLAGYAVTTRHVVVNPRLSEKVSPFAGYRGEWEESAVAAPIMRKGAIAGCFLLSSTQPDYFHPAHLVLVEQYAELLELVFEQDDYYDLSRITLWPVPEAPVQHVALIGFRERVVKVMTQAVQQQHFLTFTKAERIVWQQLEAEFFSLPGRDRQQIAYPGKED